METENGSTLNMKKMKHEKQPRFFIFLTNIKHIHRNIFLPACLNCSRIQQVVFQVMIVMKQDSVARKFRQDFMKETHIVLFGIDRIATIEDIIIPEIVTSKVIVMKFDATLHVWVFFQPC